MTKQNEKRQRGLTLIEVATGVLIIGLTLGAAIALYERAQQQQQMDVTFDRMDAITQALSVYAETAGRLPCPADPSVPDAASSPADDPNDYLTFGWEFGVTSRDLKVSATHFPVGYCGGAGSGLDASGAAPGATPSASDRQPPYPAEGIVPFMTLGLPAETARDGWGRYFTYAVSPVFARRNDQSLLAGALKDTGTVHGRCRNTGWTGPYNHNPVKARFCCADQAAPAYDAGSDLVVEYTDAATVLSPAREAAAGGSYFDINAPLTTLTGGSNVPYAMKTDAATPPGAAPAHPIEAPAFVLVSHGPDGVGAYLGNNTANRYQSSLLAAPGYALEKENANADPTFVDGPWNTGTPGAANPYFDDIVRWMTQDGIMAAHGALSCQYP